MRKAPPPAFDPFEPAIAGHDSAKKAFLALRTRLSQAIARQNRSLRNTHRLATRLSLMVTEMQLARQSLINAQQETIEVLDALEAAHQRELKSRN